jgi:2-hydroxychromene-2-carboxylate isomerase
MTMTAIPHAEFLFDFGSPNAYLAHQLLPDIEQRTGAMFRYTPVLLGGIFKATNNRSPMVTFAEVPNKLAYEQLELQRFVKKYAIPFQMNPFFPVNSLLLMRIVTAAWLDGDVSTVFEAGMQHMWVEPKKMDDPEIVRAALAQSGLQAERLLKRAQEQDVKEALIQNTQAAVARGVFGLPSFFVNNELFFGKDRLRDVEEELERKRS